MFIDVHCHFFTKNMLTDNTVSFIKAISRRIPNSSSKAPLTQIDNENFLAFINTGIQSTPKKLYQDMAIAYQEDFIAVPLMLDLTYASSVLHDNAPVDPETFDHNKRVLVRFLRQKTTHKNENMMSSMIAKLNGYTSLVGSNKNYFTNSLETQIEELITVKKQIPDRIFPFFSIDPRHMLADGSILDKIKKYVGKDKPFTGLKLYTSLGYSPTDPVLFNKDPQVETVYKWCEKKQIPITVHFSNQGFSNLVNEHKINGHVYYPEAGRPVLAKDLYEDSTIKYKSKLPTIKYEDFVKERLISLNHPALWKMVLEHYPKLKINFAHLGGNKQIMTYLDHSTLAFWTESVLEMMRDYKNVYTDLSCFDTPNQSVTPIKQLHDDVYVSLSRDMKERFMYGSDYFMLTLFENNLHGYLEKFKQGFGKDFHHIAYDNPSKFLDLRRVK